MTLISLSAVFLEVTTLTTDLHLKSVEELAPLLEAKKLSPVELTKAILDFARKST